MIKKNDHPRSVVVVVAMITALALIGDSMLYIALPVFWKEAGLDSIWQVGIILSINRFIRLPLHPIIGWLYQKISIKTGLVIAVILGAITTCGYGIAQDFTTWVILRCLWGLAWSLFRIGGLSTVVFHSDDTNRGQTMGTYNGVYRLGSLFGMLLGGIFVPILGFAYISIIFGIISAIGLPMILKTHIEKGEHQEVLAGKSVRHIPIKRILLMRNTLLVILSGFIVSMLFQGIFTSTLSSAIEHYFGIEITLLGFIVTVTALSGFIQSARWMWEPFLARLIGNWSDGLKNRIPLYMSCLLFGGLTFASLSVSLPIIFWVMIVFLVMLVATALTTLTDTLASDVAKSSSVVSFMTIYSITQDLGAALGPFIAYLFITLENGFNYIFIGGSTLFMLMAILWLGQWNRTKNTINRSKEIS